LRLENCSVMDSRDDVSSAIFDELEKSSSLKWSRSPRMSSNARFSFILNSSAFSNVPVSRFGILSGL